MDDEETVKKLQGQLTFDNELGDQLSILYYNSDTLLCLDDLM